MPRNDIIRRMIAAEFRVVREDGKAPKIVGYGARFNEATTIGKGRPWAFLEKVAPGAFAEVLKTSDCRALFNHDSNHVLGRQSAGTLSVYEDEAGLRYEITPPDTQEARDLMVLLERGDIRESSFSFNLDEGGDEWDDTVKPPIRTIRKVSALFDVGPVTFAAYPTASAGVRSDEQVAADHAAAIHHEKKGEARRSLRMLRMRTDVLEIAGRNQR
jgi:uncharacterized protein